jgi:hypothetical protein
MTCIEEQQQKICKKYSADFLACDLTLKVGISCNVKNGERPIHGVRVKQEKETSGWYIWAGEWSDDPDFYVPIHGIHLYEWEKIILPYLGLPEGWRFLITEDYEDVWYDPEVLLK